MKRLFLLLLVVLTAFTALAQSTTSAIAGRVLDADGTPLADVLVTALHTPTATLYHVTTDALGIYRFNGVMAGGPYDLKADDFAHKPAIRQHITAPLGSRIEIDLIFSATTVQLNEVVVEASSKRSNMNVERSGVGTHIDNSQFGLVPSATGVVSDLLRLVPQAVNTGTSFSMGGGSYRGTSVMVDGANFNNAFGIGASLPAGGDPISMEAVEQISVSLTPFDVRHSGFNGGTVNVVTKRGTNTWHAAVYDLVTGSNVRGHFVGNQLASRNSTLYNILGTSVSGPIVKDKLFFFLNAEYVTDRQAGSTVSARSSDSYAFGGSTGLVRPTIGQMETIREFLSTQFGYNPGRYQNYNISTPDYKLLARLDWHISQQHQFHLRFSHTHASEAMSASNSMSPLGATNTRFAASDGNTYTFNRYDAGRQSIYALAFESANYTQDANLTTLAAELNSWLFDGRGNNILRATWSYQNDPRSYVGGLFPTVDILEAYLDANGQKQYAIFTTFGPDPFTYGNLRRVSTLNVTDEFTYSLGRHNLTIGLQYERNRITNGFMQGGAGWYIYESWDAFVNDALYGTTAPNAFMITHANADDPTITMHPAFDRNQMSAYFQDELDLSRYFKLTLGLRLEMPFYAYVFDNYNVDFARVAVANPTSSFAGLSTDGLPRNNVSLSPRLAFNWDLLHNRHLVLRGGTGLFTGMLPNVWLVSAAGNANCLQYQYINNPTAYGAVPVHFHASRTDILNDLYAGTPFGQTVLPAPTSGTFFDPSFRMPSHWKSSLSLDGELPLGIQATLEGLFSYSFNEVCATALGYTQQGTVRLPGEPQDRLLYVDEGITNAAGATMHGYKLTNADGLHGHYASATLQLKKDFDCHLQLMAAYTYATGRNVNDALGDQVYELNSGTYNVHGTNQPELGYSAFVTPHRLIVSLAYDIPHSHGATHLALFYEGFNIGVVQGHYASRASYLLKTNVSGILGGTALLYVPTADELAAMPFASDDNRDAFNQFIEQDAYLASHRGEYAERNSATAPWLSRVNIRLSREFFFTIAGRRQSVELGVDLVNLANLFNADWGLYKELSSQQVLEYKNGQYAFTKPEWNDYNNLSSTWQLLGRIRYAF